MRAPRVEQEIIHRLYPGAWLVVDLVASIASSLSVSIQGVYKAIRKLKNEEVVTVHGKSIALSGVWIAKEKEKLLFAETAYRSAAAFKELVVADKGKMTCIFKTLSEVDLYWTHAYFQLAELVPESEASYAIQPHDWYLYVRTETDTYWVKKHRETHRLSRTLLTHAEKLDQQVMRLRKRELGTLFEFTLNENPFKQESATYYSILGPYVFTVQFDTNVTDRLNSFIQKHEALPLSADVQSEISDIVRMKGAFKITIEKSEAKAGRMIKKVKKYFEFN